jgi:hypothetical protein
MPVVDVSEASPRITKRPPGLNQGPFAAAFWVFDRLRRPCQVGYRLHHRAVVGHIKQRPVRA